MKRYLFIYQTGLCATSDTCSEEDMQKIAETFVIGIVDTKEGKFVDFTDYGDCFWNDLPDKESYEKLLQSQFEPFGL